MIVAYEVAKRLQLPLDIMVPREIVAPGNPDFSIGALTEEGPFVLNASLVKSYGIGKDYLVNELEAARYEAKRRVQKFRDNKEALTLKDKQVLLIDEGIATGFKMKAAILSLKMQGVKAIMVAVPVAPCEATKTFKALVDGWLVLHESKIFTSISQFYDLFPEVTDEEVSSIVRYYQPLSS